MFENLNNLNFFFIDSPMTLTQGSNFKAEHFLQNLKTIHNSSKEDCRHKIWKTNIRNFPLLQTVQLDLSSLLKFEIIWIICALRIGCDVDLSILAWGIGT